MRESTLTGEKLKLWRLSKGWKRPFLAHELGVGISTLCEWEASPGYITRLAALALRTVEMNQKPLGEKL
jgi:hypothetical protein